jgi:hypothetical protein
MLKWEGSKKAHNIYKIVSFSRNENNYNEKYDIYHEENFANESEVLMNISC